MEVALENTSWLTGIPCINKNWEKDQHPMVELELYIIDQTIT